MSLLGRKHPDERLRCSFCRNSQDAVGKLISGPSDYPRAYICDECIQVCNSIIEDDKRASEPDVEAVRQAGRFLHHPLAAEFVIAAECWAVRDLTGLSALDELAHMRGLAARMLSEQDSSLVAQEETPKV